MVDLNRVIPSFPILSRLLAPQHSAPPAKLLAMARKPRTVSKCVTGVRDAIKISSPQLFASFACCLDLFMVRTHPVLGVCTNLWLYPPEVK